MRDVEMVARIFFEVCLARRLGRERKFENSRACWGIGRVG